jgi:hypothetical protein
MDDSRGESQINGLAWEFGAGNAAFQRQQTA